MCKPVPDMWAVAIAAWIVWQRDVLDNTEDTCTTRRQHLERLARGIGVANPWAVTAEQLRAWFQAQRASRWGTETARGHRSSYRSFFGWGQLAGHVVTSPALQLPRVKPSPPNPQPVPDRVYETAYAAGTDRERLMMELGALHGLRRGEISRVHSRDLVPDLAGWSLLVHGKGRRERLVPLLDVTAGKLLALPAGWAFPGRDQGHLSPRWVGTLLSRLLGDYTAHKLRHRAGTRWWEMSDHDLATVQELLGHASPATTRIYVRVGRDRLRAVVNAAA